MKTVHQMQKRQKQRLSLIDAAEQIIATAGLDALKIRPLAAQLGIALGQIYNLVGDLDELILHVNSRTLARLEAMLVQKAKLEQFPKSVTRDWAKNCGDNTLPIALAEEKLIALSLGYHHFARENYYLWHALFYHRPTEQQAPLPAWVSLERLRPFRLVESLLPPLCPNMSTQDIRIFAQTLFSAVHGIVLIALDARDVGVPKTHLDEQLRLHLSLLCQGLKT